MLVAFNGLATIGAVGASAVSIVGHLKNYRKPTDQRLVVRILFMVPLFAITSYTNLAAPKVGHFLEPIKELYEAFVIYTFFTLLTNILGGEREIIFSTTGRPPVSVMWPFDYVFKNIDISDPITFVTIKRLIMQYVYLRPILTLLGLIFGHRIWLFNTILYNVSVTLALNALAVFWFCLYTDLKPYNVMLKFLSIKLIVFFSYWQSLALAILHSVGAIQNEQTRINISNTLITVEMFGFSLLHFVAFPYTDYATTALIGFARLPIYYAIRDTCGPTDLISDFKNTFLGTRYGYRNFDSIESVLDHPESRSRRARLAAGLRYKNQGKSKYWLPIRSLARRFKATVTGAGYGATDTDEMNSSTRGAVVDSVDEQQINDNLSETSQEVPESYQPVTWDDDDLEADEHLYRKARMSYGDYNFPAITVRESIPYVTIQERERRRSSIEPLLRRPTSNA